MAETYKFSSSQVVTWDPETSKIPGGLGWICCPATREEAIIGRLWVVEVDGVHQDVNTDEYPFNYVIVPESYLTAKE